jgi:hypothetical protein
VCARSRSRRVLAAHRASSRERERGVTHTPYRAVAHRPPLALVEMGELAGWLCDAADAGNWSSAAQLLASINESASRLPDPLPHPQLAGRLQSRLEHLAEQVRRRNRVAALEDANATTLLVADISGWFHLPEESYAAYLLSYYGRQLEIGIATGRSSTLTRATTDLRSTWDTLRDVVEQRSEAASRFTDIVVQLERAARPADYVAPTRAARAEADRMQKLFRSRGADNDPWTSYSLPRTNRWLQLTPS